MYSLLNNGKVWKENEIGEGLVVSDDVLEGYIRTYIYIYISNDFFLDQNQMWEERRMNETNFSLKSILSRIDSQNKYLTIN